MKAALRVMSTLVLTGLFVTLCMLGLPAWTFAADEIVIVHFGDSTTNTGYLRKERKRVNDVLQGFLEKYYPQQKFRCVNVGRGGDYIRQFLDGGRYQKAVKDVYAKIDIAAIRYGQNDMKHYRPEQFKKHLKELIDVLKKDYPGVHIFLETGIYIDPRHWFDQYRVNPRPVKKYGVYWRRTREVAQELKLPLIDQEKRWQIETEAGTWDLRIRGNKDPKHPQHYYNAHPNELGVRIYALEILRHLRHYYPTKLPKAGEDACNPKENPVDQAQPTGGKLPEEEKR